jgi:hypothetical protein
MKVKLKIESKAFKRDLEVEFDWNLPVLPRMGEVVSPNIIMSNMIDIESTLNNLSYDGRKDFDAYSEGKQEKNDVFYTWLWEIINQVNIVRSVHYEIDKGNSIQIYPIIYLSDE